MLLLQLYGLLRRPVHRLLVVLESLRNVSGLLPGLLLDVLFSSLHGMPFWRIGSLKGKLHEMPKILGVQLCAVLCRASGRVLQLLLGYRDFLW